MNRPRKKDTHLPPNVYLRHGAYWHVKRGKWTRLGKSLRESLATYATLYEAPEGGMGELIERALVEILPKVKPSTAKGYMVAGRKLKKAFREFTPKEVKPKDVAAMKRGMESTPNFANRCLSVLRQVFDYALEREMIDSNPAVGIKRHPENKRTRLLSSEEYAAIYVKAGPRLQVVMDLLRLTGQRITDVLRIRRADIVDGKISFVQQKTGAKVAVSSPELPAVIDRAKTMHGNIRALTLLHNRRGKAPDYSTIKIQWSKACKAAGVEDARLHDLRAVSATAARKQGKNPTALLGHTSQAQTERYLRDREETQVEGPSFGDLLAPKKI